MQRPLACLIAVVFLGLALAGAHASDLGATILDRTGIAGGVCALVRCGDGELAHELATEGNLLVHATDSRPEMVEATRQRADAAGMLGSEVIAETGDVSALPYADNSVDIVILPELAPADLEALSPTEVLRVLRPLGKAYIGQAPDSRPRVVPRALREWAASGGIDDPTIIVGELGTWIEMEKPPAEGVDDWSHWFHGADNNPSSSDSVIQAPYMTQWMGTPYNITMPAITTASAGRIFLATGHIAHHPREEATLNMITARNGYNGRVLWTRELPEGYLVHRSAFIATPDIFYLIDGSSVLMLDSESGAEEGRISFDGITGDLTWIAMQNGVIYAQAQDDYAPAETKIVNSPRDHWSWGELSPGYYTDRVPWGFGKHLGAYSTSSGKTLWTHSEPTVIDSRSLGVCEDRLYFYAPESRIGCIDADSGSVLWSTNDPEVMEKLEMKGQGLVSTPGFRSNCNILCTEDVVFFEAQTHLYVLALSAKDGSLLWFREKTRNNPTLLYVDGKLITSHLISGTLAVDPLTGREEQKLNFSKVNCVRMNATPDAFYCRGEGLGVYDRETDTYKVDGSVRPGCNDGALPANGLLYVGPWACDCNLSLIGTVTLCSAGDFDFNVVATNESNLQLGAGDPATVQPLDASDLDWPTYRANTQRSGSSQVALKEEHPVPGWWHKPTDACKVTPPVAAGGLVFFGREDGKVRCLNAETGDVAWDYVTAGPIIQPPTIWEGRCYVGSGDGYVYCIEAATGRLLWRFRAAPVERRMMVYDHLMSTWPVNSGILIEDGVAYAAAGIIDRDGTYVYALDAKTGEIAWQNNGTGHIDPDLRKGASVQGGLAIGGGRLWLAGGNQVSPTPFDLKTGECKNWLKPQGRPSTPRGREIGVWMDKYIVHGGRLLYSDPAKSINPGQFSFVPLDENGNIKYPPMMPMHRSCLAPAWDDTNFVALTERYGQLVCWDNDLLTKAFDVRQKEEELRQEAMKRAPNQNERNRKRWQTDSLLDGLFRHTGRWGPVERQTLCLALTKNFVVTVAGPAPWQNEDANGRWTILGINLETGKEQLWHGCPSEPMENGMCIDRDGRIIVALKNGEIYCTKEKPEETG